MQVWIVTGEHFNVPGRLVIVCASEEIANREAATLVNMMLKDTRDTLDGGDDTGIPGGDATPMDWRTYESALTTWHDDECYVEVSDHDVMTS